MSSPNALGKKVGGKAKGTTVDDSRRRRDEHTVQIRKNKQQELIAKHRKVSPPNFAIFSSS